MKTKNFTKLSEEIKPRVFALEKKDTTDESDFIYFLPFCTETE